MSPQEAAGGSSSAGNSSSNNTPAPSAGSNTSAGSGSGTVQTPDESLVCKWNNCNQSFTTPEILYDHLCERHVGRKNTNNLCLTCQWNQCRTTTVKRDHITSHIRVHVPLKPHKCDFCGKSFKRPQDLKKHVKTHADESVLGAGRPEAQAGGYRPGHQGRAPTNGYYDQHHGHIRTNAPGFPTQAGHPNYYGGAPQPSSNYLYMGGAPQSTYGTTARTNDFLGHTVSSNGISGGQKRGYEESIGDLFNAVKRRSINNDYAAISGAVAPLVGLNSMGGIGVSAAPMAASYMTAPAPSLRGPMPSISHMHTAANPMAQTYVLPSNMQSKKELEDIRDTLEAWRGTLYEAAQGSQSPPLIPRDAMNLAAEYNSLGGQVSPALGSETSEGSAAMTPPSPGSAHSLSSQSPSPSLSSLSPQTRHTNINTVRYPTLPNLNSNFPGQMPTPMLGPNFETDGRQYQHGGNYLKRAREMLPPPAPRSVVPDTSKVPTPKAGSPVNARSPSSESDSSETRERDARYERWQETVKTVEWLCEYVKRQIDKAGPAQADAPARRFPDAMDMDEPKEVVPKMEAPSTYPTIRVGR